jgi:hypothetical protein
MPDLVIDTDAGDVNTSIDQLVDYIVGVVRNLDVRRGCDVVGSNK